MPYRQNVITSANPARDMVLEIEPDMLAAGWSFVEEVIITTTTYRVYRSNAASNARGLDFHVSLQWTTLGGTTIAWKLFETWDPVLKRGDRWATNATFSSSGTPTAIDYLANTGPQLLSYSGAYTPSLVLVTTGFTYYSSVTPDRIIFGARYGNTDQGFYCGLYDSFMPLGEDPFPLTLQPLQVGIGANGTQYGSSTREPKTTTAVTYNFWTFIAAANDPLAVWTRNLQQETYSGRSMPSRVILWGARLGNAAATGAARGLLKDVIASPFSGVSAANGDTAAFDVPGATPSTVTWIRVGNAAGQGHDYYMPMFV